MSSSRYRATSLLVRRVVAAFHDRWLVKHGPTAAWKRAGLSGHRGTWSWASQPQSARHHAQNAALHVGTLHVSAGTVDPRDSRVVLHRRSAP
mmetsp:Transcript_10989/g.34885  ORF Transcript_10989/g.34885 Transcript_10989/m.34885 type:complete len:92 (+) Transcript_10989:1239-1514(+)